MAPTPQAPSPEQTPTPDARYVPGQSSPAQLPPEPPVQPGMPPAGWYAPPYNAQPVMPPRQQYYRPTGAQRVGVAIASVALLIPLLAISLGIITTLIPYVSAGIAATIGLIAAALVCLAVVCVNVSFNFDVLRERR